VTAKKNKVGKEEEFQYGALLFLYSMARKGLLMWHWERPKRMEEARNTDTWRRRSISRQREWQVKNLRGRSTPGTFSKTARKL
jgi:hypothetical protein